MDASQPSRIKRRDACPICGKAEAEPYRPFCSARCAYIDLGRWLGEGYRIPTDEAPANDPVPAGKMAEDDDKSH